MTRSRRFLLAFDGANARTIVGYDLPCELPVLCWDVLRLALKGRRPRRYQGGWPPA